MKNKLLLIFGLIGLMGVMGCMAGPTNPPVAGTYAVTVGTNGVLLFPPNFFTANADSFATAGTNGMMSQSQGTTLSNNLAFTIRTFGTNETNYAISVSMTLQQASLNLSNWSTLGTNWFVATNDPRLTNARTPLAHTHVSSDVTGLDGILAGKLVASLNLSDLANAATARANLGVISAVGLTNLLTNAIAGVTNGFVSTNDLRLTNARPPTVHFHQESDITNLVADLAARATKAANGSDFANPATVRTNIGAAAAPVQTNFNTTLDGVNTNWYSLFTNYPATSASGTAEISILNSDPVVNLKFDYKFDDNLDSHPPVIVQRYYANGAGLPMQVRTLTDGFGFVRMDVQVPANYTVTVTLSGDNVFGRNSNLAQTGHWSLHTNVTSVGYTAWLFIPQLQGTVQTADLNIGGTFTATNAVMVTPTVTEAVATNNPVTLFYATNSAAAQSNAFVVALVATNLSLTNRIIGSNAAQSAALVATNLALTNAIIQTNLQILALATNAANLRGAGTTNFTVAEPSKTNNAATKAYVDAHAGGGSGLTNIHDTSSGVVITNAVVEGQITATAGMFISGNADFAGGATIIGGDDGTISIGSGVHQLNADSTFSLSSGNFTGDGSGNLTAAGYTSLGDVDADGGFHAATASSFDSGSITTDGTGDITAASFSGVGSELLFPSGAPTGVTVGSTAVDGWVTIKDSDGAYHFFPGYNNH